MGATRDDFVKYPRTPHLFGSKGTDGDELDSVPEAIPELEHLCFFKEEMLMMFHAAQKLHLDVGWFPSGDLVRGAYCLVLAKCDCYDQPIRELRTRDSSALVAEIQRLLVNRAMQLTLVVFLCL